MKKLYFLFATFMMALAFAACGDGIGICCLWQR